MELTEIIAVTLALLALLVSGPLAWIIKSLISDVRRLERDLSKHRTHIAEHYVEKDDLYRELEDIKALVKKLFDKFDAFIIQR